MPVFIADYLNICDPVSTKACGSGFEPGYYTIHHILLKRRKRIKCEKIQKNTAEPVPEAAQGPGMTVFTYHNRVNRFFS